MSNESGCSKVALVLGAIAAAVTIIVFVTGRENLPALMGKQQEDRGLPTLPDVPSVRATSPISPTPPATIRVTPTPTTSSFADGEAVMVDFIKAFANGGDYRKGDALWCPDVRKKAENEPVYTMTGYELRRIKSIVSHPVPITPENKQAVEEVQRGTVEIREVEIQLEIVTDKGILTQAEGWTIKLSDGTWCVVQVFIQQ